MFWRPVGFSTYIFGGDPLFPPTRARAFNARARALAEIGPRTWTPKQGEAHREATRGSHNREPLRAQTDQPDPQLIENKRDEKKKTYEILWLFNMKKNV